MLYNLLTNYSDTYSFLNFFNFLTVRTGLAVITAMIVVFLIGDRFINYFSTKRITNPIRSDGPEDHLIKKIGTPKYASKIYQIWPSTKPVLKSVKQGA